MATKGNKNKKIEQTEAKKVLDSVKNLNLGNVITEVGELQVNVQTALANLSSDLTSKIQQLDQVDNAIKLKEMRLKELYEIENAAITLDDIKAQKESELKNIQEQHESLMSNYEEEEQNYLKKWQRETEEMNYNRAQETKKWKDEFDAEVALAKRNEAVRHEMLQKTWAEREENLKSKETEMQELKKLTSNFDAKLKQDVDAAILLTSTNCKKENMHQIELLKKEHEKTQIADQSRIASQDETIKNMKTQIENLQNQLDSSRKDAKDIAQQALQSASGRQSTHVMSLYE